MKKQQKELKEVLIKKEINNQYVKVAMISGKEKKVQDAIDIIKSSGYEVFDYYINPDGKLTQQFKVGENTHEK